MLRRVTTEGEAALCEPLLREYTTWAKEVVRLRYGIDNTDVRIDQMREAFRREWPNRFAPRGRLYLATMGDTPVGVGALKPATAEEFVVSEAEL